MKVVADTMGVARSNLIQRLKGITKPRQRYHKAQDLEVVRRITAIRNRQLRSEGLLPVNHKRVYRIMKAHNLLLARKYS